MAVTFLDTSVLLAGILDFGPQSAPAQSIMHAVAEKIVQSPATAWHLTQPTFPKNSRAPCFSDPVMAARSPRAN